MKLAALLTLPALLAFVVLAERKPGIAAAKDELLVYIGTYTGEKISGIYIARLDLTTGELSAPQLAVEVKSPSFLAVHPNRKFLYSVNEISDLNGKPTGGVSEFALDSATGQLKLLNQQSSQGAGPCHLVVDGSGQAVLVANYGGGSIAAGFARCGWQARTGGFGDSTPGSQYYSESASRPTCVFDQSRSRQQVCRGGRSRPGRTACLSLRCS